MACPEPSLEAVTDEAGRFRAADIGWCPDTCRVDIYLPGSAKPAMSEPVMKHCPKRPSHLHSTACLTVVMDAVVEDSAASDQTESSLLQRALGGRPPLLPDEELTADERAYLARLDHGERIEAVAVVQEFHERTEVWQDSDGITRSWDLAVLRVQTPERFAGRSLPIHPLGTPASSPWRKIGSAYRISVPLAVFEQHDYLKWFGPGVVKTMEPAQAPPSH